MQTRLRVEVEEDDAEYTIFVDGKPMQFYHFDKHSEDYGFKHIEIVVSRGRVKIPSTCHASYPGRIVFQEDYIDWFYSDKYKQNVWYDHNISFHHLYPQGPSYFDHDKPIWNFSPICAGHLMSKEVLTKTIRNMVCP
jgi:hypothetical protein